MRVRLFAAKLEKTINEDSTNVSQAIGMREWHLNRGCANRSHVKRIAVSFITSRKRMLCRGLRGRKLNSEHNTAGELLHNSHKTLASFVVLVHASLERSKRFAGLW